MAPITAFLSYTRTDDEFYGGYITAFRKVLESAVHVVTGEKTFRIFQDVDGIVIGEDWRKKLSQALQDSSFLIPMLTPLFFSSRPCREELTEFIAHEKALDRNDLILPIYFFTSAKLEKKDGLVEDELADELAKRQMFDWRKHSDLPLESAAARQAVLELATEIAARVPTVAAKSGAGPGASKSGTKAGFDIGVEGEARRQPLPPKTILWVDDNPHNNVWEREALASYGYKFAMARSTIEAEALMDVVPFSAIVSDMGRAGDRAAGLTLLGEVRGRGSKVPFLIYTSGDVARRMVDNVHEQGGTGITADPDNLVQMLVASTR